MFLLEHDAKTLLTSYGVSMPLGVLLDRADVDGNLLPPAPWMIKAQIAAGGRGKADLIRPADTIHGLQAQMRELLGRMHRGMAVRACRVETQVIAIEEAYLSFSLDPISSGVRIIVSAQGGVDIETSAAVLGAVRTATAAPQLTHIMEEMERITAGIAPHIAAALNNAASELARAFLEAELALLEINPLFVRSDGSWIAGDAKVVTDDDALYRQPRLRTLLDSRAQAYPEAWRKLHYGCDYVVVDPDGEIGLLTTGAGLSMMLIDELRSVGLRPYNFLDVRTGGLRGDATRLINVLEWIAEGRSVRVLLINIFAGITDLSEFVRLLSEALQQVPQLKLPLVARLVGTNMEAARDFLAARGVPTVTELSAAIAHVRQHLV